MTLMQEVEPTVQAFTAVMREKLSENEHKGHWRGMTPMALMERLYDEVFELAQAVRTEGPRAVAREAADVGAFAMMVADVVGGLASYTAAGCPSTCCSGRLEMVGRAWRCSGGCGYFVGFDS